MKFQNYASYSKMNLQMYFFDKVLHQALNGQTNVQQTQLTNKNENVGNRYTFSQISSTVAES